MCCWAGASQLHVLQLVHTNSCSLQPCSVLCISGAVCVAQRSHARDPARKPSNFSSMPVWSTRIVSMALAGCRHGSCGCGPWLGMRRANAQPCCTAPAGSCWEPSSCTGQRSEPHWPCAGDGFICREACDCTRLRCYATLWVRWNQLGSTQSSAGSGGCIEIVNAKGTNLQVLRWQCQQVKWHLSARDFVPSVVRMYD